MAMFDRRLLAYFEDNSLREGATLADKIADYQNDIAQLDNELLRYQHLLGGKHRVRNREKWRPPTETIKDKYASALETAQEEEEEVRRHIQAARAGGGTARDGGARGDLNDHPGARGAGGGRAPGGNPTEAQLDKLIGLPVAPGSRPGEASYVVRMSAEPSGVGTEETKPMPARPSDKRHGAEDCRVRQRIMVPPGARWIKLDVLRVGHGGQKQSIGHCRVDAEDQRNFSSNLVHPLGGPRGETGVGEFRLQLARWTSSRRPSTASGGTSVHERAERAGTTDGADSAVAASLRIPTHSGRHPSTAGAPLHQGSAATGPGSAMGPPVGRKTTDRATASIAAPSQGTSHRSSGEIPLPADTVGPAAARGPQRNGLGSVTDTPEPSESGAGDADDEDEEGEEEDFLEEDEEEELEGEEEEEETEPEAPVPVKNRKAPNARN